MSLASYAYWQVSTFSFLLPLNKRWLFASQSEERQGWAWALAKSSIKNTELRFSKKDWQK